MVELVPDEEIRFLKQDCFIAHGESTVWGWGFLFKACLMKLGQTPVDLLI
jgi:hypothetical protein